jgi:hypothetical protein
LVTHRTYVRVTRDTSRACGRLAAARGKVRDPLENDAIDSLLDASIGTAHGQSFEKRRPR